MKSFYKIAIVTILFSISAACGGSIETSSNSNNRIAADTSTNQIPPAENNAPQPAENQPTDANAIAEKKSVTRQSALQSSSDSNSNVQVIPINPEQIKTKNPAVTLGDGSEISTILGTKGAIETRTFKNNPQLARLERTTNGKDVSVKVFLKNGKVVSIAKDKIQNFTNDSAEQILRAAGIEPKPAPQNPETKGGEKTYTFTFPVKPSN